jgi:hypothetical protein
MMERANSNIGARKWSKDCSQVGVSRSDNGRPRNGVLRYAPPESGRTLVRGDDLSQEVSKENALSQTLHAGLVILVPAVSRVVQQRLFKAALDELAVVGEPVNRVLEVDLDGAEVTLTLYDWPSAGT